MVLGGGGVLMSEVPLYTLFTPNPVFQTLYSIPKPPNPTPPSLPQVAAPLLEDHEVVGMTSSDVHSMPASSSDIHAMPTSSSIATIFEAKPSAPLDPASSFERMVTNERAPYDGDWGHRGVAHGDADYRGVSRHLLAPPPP